MAVLTIGAQPVYGLPTAKRKLSQYAAAVLSTPGLVSYWRFGETSGSCAVDSAGTNPGTYVNGPLLGLPGALLYDPNTAIGCQVSTQSYVSVADAASLKPSRLTVMGWVGATSNAYYSYVARKGYAFGLRLEISGGVLFHLNSGAVLSSSPTNLADGGWHHLAGVMDGTYALLYADGSQVGSANCSSVTWDATALVLGANVPGGEPGNDSVDEVAYFNAALTATQISALYSLASQR